MFNKAMDVPVAETSLPAEPPVAVRRPVRQTVPIVFASPHSGSAYTPDFLLSSRLDPLSLRRSEDSFVDDLFAEAPSFGAPLLTAGFPRAFCDANREAWELDPAMFEEPLPPWVNTTSSRVGAGLGTLARVVATGETIYRGKLPFAEAERRVRACWQPYHETLAALIGGTTAMFGTCLLIDCHSMPAQGSPAGGPARTDARTLRGGTDFVLGDAHGTACAPRITRFVEQTL
ncbi:MAG: N-formylglutamate amidohydrolase, partial [Acetobacteraceae bacterium]